MASTNRSRSPLLFPTITACQRPFLIRPPMPAMPAKAKVGDLTQEMGQSHAGSRESSQMRYDG